MRALSREVAIQVRHSAQTWDEAYSVEVPTPATGMQLAVEVPSPSQPDLKRVDAGVRSYVDQMLREVAKRLLGDCAARCIDERLPASNPMQKAQQAAWAEHKHDCKRLALVGRSIVLQELSTAELNGERGIVDSWDSNSGRFVVHLTSGRQIKGKPEKVKKDTSTSPPLHEKD